MVNEGSGQSAIRFSLNLEGVDGQIAQVGVFFAEWWLLFSEVTTGLCFPPGVTTAMAVVALGGACGDCECSGDLRGADRQARDRDAGLAPVLMGGCADKAGTGESDRHARACHTGRPDAESFSLFTRFADWTSCAGAAMRPR
jgi:hypothetical protein